MPDNITQLRRANAQALYRAWAQARVAAGDGAKGLEQAFAAQIQVSASMWSQIKKDRPISDKLARQIEHHAARPAGWLDQPHEESGVPDSAEQHFLEVARAAWRGSNAKGKRDLLRQLRGIAEGASAPRSATRAQSAG